MTLGERIKLARRTMGRTQVQLGREIGIWAQHISGWECGVARPSDKNLHKIEEALGVRSRWLVSGRGWMVIPRDRRAGVEPFLRLGGVQRILLLRSIHGPEGVLVEVVNDVVSVRLNLSLNNEKSLRSYCGLLRALKNWGGPVGRAEVRADQENRFEELDLSTLFKDIICTRWIADDELARLKPRGTLMATRLDGVTGQPWPGAVKKSGRSPVPVTPKMLKAIAERDPELAAIIEMLEDADLQIRAKVYSFLLTSRQATKEILDLLVGAMEHVSQAEPPPRTVQRRASTAPKTIKG